jgi:UDP-N-acetylmuramate: L-alanyl-gamma-D-glutamyl-meso-diaminopimelate ligase
MRVHFIAIGGSAMHNLAIALKENGANVSGSDDEIFEPSKSRLARHGILPTRTGWFPETINDRLDAIILGMHARPDNPELLRALELGLKVYSYPEYLYEQCKTKKRVVVGGSHGKTTVTSMIMHVLKHQGVDFDYMVGAQLEGFDTMVHLSPNSKIAVFEGDEYLSSPIDSRPKFLWYKPHIALLTGIAWDHINVFPTIENYNQQFDLFIHTIDPHGLLTYFEGDPDLRAVVAGSEAKCRLAPYNALAASVKDDLTVVHHCGNDYPVAFFGDHNLQNMAGAMVVCEELGVKPEHFLQAMQSFKGAARRLQVLGETEDAAVFYDFAHAPSKVKATMQAVRSRYPQRHLTAFLELHTFSSLNRDFLSQYADSMKPAHQAFVFFDPHVVAHKKLPPISVEEVAKGFNLPVTSILTDVEVMKQKLEQLRLQNANLLIMTSGNLAGINLKELANRSLGL